MIVANAQRQASVRAAWSAAQRAGGQSLWNTPRVFTFTQFAEARLGEQWSAANLPDRLLPAGAEWACLRDLRREGGGSGEARALLASVRTLRDWQIARSPAVLGGSPEGNLLLEAMAALDRQSRDHGRKPLAEWIGGIEPLSGGLWSAGVGGLPSAQRAALQRLGAREVDIPAMSATVSVAAAEDDEHELASIADWCRAHLERDPARRLLVVDAKL
ncbi:MAG TPA: hypothetical protein VFX94_06650, partial [Burkholderiales bacterium]|nr:hypothetical protein [Burkholderiales bacterium]